MNADAMIEKGAKAIWLLEFREDDKGPEVDDAMVYCRKLARAVLEATIPGILAGTCAELPLEATEEMKQAPYEVRISTGGFDHWRDLYRAMVSAYLGKKDADAKAHEDQKG